MENAGGAWLTGRCAREQIRAPLVTMTGPSVHIVRLLGTTVLRCAFGAVVLVGCLSVRANAQTGAAFFVVSAPPLGALVSGRGQSHP